MRENTENIKDSSFTKRLKEAIGKNSIRSFAANCGLSESVLRQYLTGKSDPTRQMLIAIAREGKVTIGWLADGSDYKDRSFRDNLDETLLADIISELETSAGEYLNKITVKEKAVIISYIYKTMNEFSHREKGSSFKKLLKEEIDSVIKTKKLIALGEESGISVDKMMGLLLRHDRIKLHEKRAEKRNSTGERIVNE